jgi:hypothetical protein
MTCHPDYYCDEKASSLPEHDGFAYFTGRAFECRDADDQAGYALNLRKSLEILPYMEDKISKLAKALKEKHAQAPPSVHEQLAKETSKLKSVIYTMVYTGNLAQAAQILEAYVEVNPTDPEIDKLRNMIAG